MTALACGCLPASAVAGSLQPTASVEPGVTIDEGSPAAKEYALALTQARHTGSSGSHASSSEAPFGAGIKPPSAPGAGGTHAASSHTRAAAHVSHPGATGSNGTGASPAPSLPAAVLRAERTGSSGGDSSLLALLGGGVAILVLGALGGVVLRHNRRPPSHA
jgi:hypothetical protein